MSDTTRAIAETVGALPASAAERFGDRLASRYKVDGEWRQMNYAETLRAIEEIAAGLATLGIEPGDRVAILSDTRLEWTLASYGISAAGGVVVPVYPTNSPRECEWVLGNSGARAVFCEDAAQVQKIASVRERLDALGHVICIVGDDAGDLSLTELRKRGADGDRAELVRRRDSIGRDDPYTIIYTSGTTGPPKGVVLTHRNAMSVCEIVEELAIIRENETTYLFLPLAHVFALTAILASFDQGTTIIYYGGDTKQILPELMETKPSYLPSVPRIFEKLYTAAMKMREAGSEEDKQRFDGAVKVGIEVRLREHRGQDVPAEMQAAFDQAEESLYSRVRGLFGGNINQAVTGAAPIASEILEFFYACGVPVLEGWGMTETTAMGTVNTLDHFKFGTVGRTLPGVEVRIAEDGEILLRGPNLFAEYWANAEATAESLVDGWLHTGDIGELDDEGYLSITGRKKDIIITAGGKNLTPANLENDLQQSRFISQAMMHGDRRPYPVALITLDEEEIVPWASEQGLPSDVASLAQTDEVRRLIQEELDRVNSHYASVEQIKKFAILKRELSVQDGELTPTLKIKRSVVNENYKELLDSLYEG
jgi:long-chain acyl-CoA synthetase